MTATLQTLLGDLNRETENLNKFVEAQNKRITELHYAVTNEESIKLAPEAIATLKLALHREGNVLQEETRKRSAKIDSIIWDIRNCCSLSLGRLLEACKVANKSITEVV